MPSSSDIRAGSAARSTAFGAYLEGWRRTFTAPHLVIGILLTTMVTSMPLAAVVGGALEQRFGSSLEAERAVGGWNEEWASELAEGQMGIASTLTREILGFGGVLPAMSWLVNGERLPGPLVGVVSVYLLLWIFLSGGTIDRLARARPLGADVFVATCGRYFLRLLRFGLTAAAGYWVLFRWLYPLIFEVTLPRLAGDAPTEGRLFALGALGYLVFLAVLGFYALVADISRVRLVVEDRYSALAGWSAGWRFVRRRAGRLSWLFLLNVIGQAIAARFWLQLAPSSASPDWMVLAATQLYLLVRVWTRLTFIASEVVFFQGELAHATYAAAPIPMWPDSASVEALRNLRGTGEGGSRGRLR